jgi:hypothetical protein
LSSFNPSREQVAKLDIDGAVDSNYIRWVTGDYDGLSLLTKTDGNADSGLALAADTVHQVAALGDATNAHTLPDAVAGTLVVIRYTAQYDGGNNNQTITCASGEFFAAQTLNLIISNNGNGLLFPKRVIGNDWTDTVAIAGGTIVTAAATDNTLTLRPTANNNQTNIGAELSFFCQTDGFWRVAFLGSELGSGAVNTSWGFSAV